MIHFKYYYLFPGSGEMRLTGNQVEELMKEEYYLSVGSGSTLLRGRVMLEQAGPSNLAGRA